MARMVSSRLQSGLPCPFVMGIVVLAGVLINIDEIALIVNDKYVVGGVFDQMTESSLALLDSLF